MANGDPRDAARHPRAHAAGAHDANRVRGAAQGDGQRIGRAAAAAAGTPRGPNRAHTAPHLADGAAARPCAPVYAWAGAAPRQAGGGHAPLVRMGQRARRTRAAKECARGASGGAAGARGGGARRQLGPRGRAHARRAAAAAKGARA
eukprot:4814715-Prymnesium_polylepis.1